MASYDNKNALEKQTLTPVQMRMLKAVVIITGIFLIVGFMGLATVLVYKIATIQKSSPAQQQTASRNTTLQIPKDANVKSLSLNNGHLAVYLSGSKTDEILILQMKTGEILNRIQLKK